MTEVVIMLILAAGFVFAVPKLLGVRLRDQSSSRSGIRREASHTARGGGPESPLSQVGQLGPASKRLVVVLLMLAAGTALAVFLIVRWILQSLERILS